MIFQFMLCALVFGVSTPIQTGQNYYGEYQYHAETEIQYISCGSFYNYYTSGGDEYELNYNIDIRVDGNLYWNLSYYRFELDTIYIGLYSYDIISSYQGYISATYSPSGIYYLNHYEDSQNLDSISITNGYYDGSCYLYYSDFNTAQDTLLEYGSQIDDSSWETSPFRIDFDISYFSRTINNYLANNDYSLNSAYSAGYNAGYNEGQGKGYQDGIQYAYEQGTEATSIFAGIIDIALVPVNFFLGIFNFEIFGINISQLVMSLLTVAIALILFRTIFNGGSGGDRK